jgi:hypothetical protein
MPFSAVQDFQNPFDRLADPQRDGDEVAGDEATLLVYDFGVAGVAGDIVDEQRFARRQHITRKTLSPLDAHLLNLFAFFSRRHFKKQFVRFGVVKEQGTGFRCRQGFCRPHDAVQDGRQLQRLVDLFG